MQRASAPIPRTLAPAPSLPGRAVSSSLAGLAASASREPADRARGTAPTPVTTADGSFTLPRVPPATCTLIPHAACLKAVRGMNGYSERLCQRPPGAARPGCNFGCDLSANDKAALRGAWGRFHDSGRNNPSCGASPSAPISYSLTLGYDKLNTYGQGSGAVGSSNPATVFGGPRSFNAISLNRYSAARASGIGQWLLKVVF